MKRHLILCLAAIPLLVYGQATTTKTTSPAADYSQEAFIIEQLHSKVNAFNDGTNTREVMAVIKILAEAGVKAFAVLNFTYTSANEAVEVDYVRVRKPDGTMVSTPDYNIQDMPGEVTRAAPIYSDIHEKHIAVKGLAAGDVLEYRIRYRTLKPQVPGQFWFEGSFIKDSITKDERLEIAVPTDKYVKVISPQSKPEIREEGGQRIYSWAHVNTSRPETTDEPKRTPSPPAVQVTTFRTWEEVGQWYGALQKEPLEITPAIRSKAMQLTKDLATDDEKIRAIYKFVSLQLHYVGLAFGIGRYQPHAADDVLGNGYGDCKDKHTLLASLLKAAGYDAWPALIHSERKLDAEVPSPAQFNHVITVVPKGKDLVWLDTTPEVAPYGLLLAGLRDKQALVVPTDKAPILMTTPANPPAPQLQTFRAQGKLDADGTYTGHVEQSCRGDVEIVMRALFRQVPQAQWKVAMQKFSYGIGFGGEVSNVTATSPEDIDKPFTFSYDYVRKSYSDWENHRLTPPLPAMGVESNKDRKKPQEAVILGAPGEIVYQSKLTLPPGYTIVPPANIDLVKPYGEYHASSSVQNGVLTTSRRLVIKKNEIGLPDWDDYRDFGKTVSDDEYTYLNLNGETTAGGGTASPKNEELDKTFRQAIEAHQMRDFIRAEELYRKVIAGNSTYRGAHVNLGLVLASVNRIDDAMAEFRKEQEINPSDAMAYDMRAMYLAFRGHRDEAILEWRKLLTVNPGNRDAALKLSSLLSMDSNYADAAKVLETATSVSPDSPTLEMALGEAYVKGGEIERGVPHLRKAIEIGGDSESNGMWMMNDAAYTLAENNSHFDLATEFAEKAVAELDALSVKSVDSDEAVQIGLRFPVMWDTVGWVYFRMGDAARAEPFLYSAWVQGQRVVIGDHLGQVYEKLGKKREAAHIYEQALAAQLIPTVSSSPVDPGLYQKEYQKQREGPLKRYEKLTGHKYSDRLEIKRLPNGEWSKTPAEELRDSLKVKVVSTTKLKGTATFRVVLAPGVVDSVTFKGGDEALRPVTEQVKAAKYPVPFPPNSNAKIVRLVKVTCAPSTGCSADLTPTNQGLFDSY